MTSKSGCCCSRRSSTVQLYGSTATIKRVVPKRNTPPTHTHHTLPAPLPPPRQQSFRRIDSHSSEEPEATLSSYFSIKLLAFTPTGVRLSRANQLPDLLSDSDQYGACFPPKWLDWFLFKLLVWKFAENVSFISRSLCNFTHLRLNVLKIQPYYNVLINNKAITKSKNKDFIQLKCIKMWIWIFLIFEVWWYN